MNRNLQDVYYNLHGKLAIRISTGNQKVLDLYNRSFRHFRSEKTTGTQQYIIRDYSCFQLPPRFFFVNYNQIGFERGFCLPDKRYAVMVNDEGITEYTDAECQATHFWLQYLLLRQNMCLIHGAGIELRGRGIIFPSFSSGGKTMLVAYVRNLDGFRFFTDEFIIADSQGTMFSFPCDFTIFNAHIERFPELRKPRFRNYFRNREHIIRILKAIENILITVFPKKRRFNPLSLSGFLAGPPVLKVPAAQIIAAEKIGTEVKMEVALFLTKYNGEEIRFEEIDHARFVDKTARVLFLEFREKFEYLLYLSVGDTVSPASHEQKLREILSASLSRVKLFEVSIPYSMDPAVFSDSIVQFLDTGGK